MAAKHEIPASVQAPRVILLLCVFALLLIGLVMVYSASSVTAIDQGTWPIKDVLVQAAVALIGIVFAVFLWKVVPYQIWTGPAFIWIWLLSLALLIATAVAGTDVYGAKRWLYIGSVGIQPSEFAKIALVLAAVRIMVLFDSGVVEPRTIILEVVIFLLLPLIIIYRFQSDLGTTAIIAVGVLGVMWYGGVSRKLFLGLLVVVALFMVYAIFGTDYRSGRMLYLDPWNDGAGGLDKGYNIIRSFYAFAEGGLFGVGLGNSHEKFQYLFASDSDFIFAVIGEELGMVGAMTVILLFFVIFVCGLRIAGKAPDLTGQLIAASLTIMLVAQAFLNIGCAIGVFPTTGKPLPLISSGGSSMLATMIMVGLILSVSRQEDEEQVYELRRNNLRVMRTHDYVDLPYMDEDPEEIYDAPEVLRSGIGSDPGRSSRRRKRRGTPSQTPDYVEAPDFGSLSGGERGALRLTDRRARSGEGFTSMDSGRGRGRSSDRRGSGSRSSADVRR